MASNSEYEQQQFFKQRLLHPKIQHINCSQNISNECLDIINKMVEKVSKMSTNELKQLKNK